MTMVKDWTEGEARLLAQRCAQGHTWYLPRARCPRCGEIADSFDVKGSGTLFSRTTVHRRPARADGTAREAIGIALVDLDEGARVMVRCPPDATIGSRVQVSLVFDEDSGRLLPECQEVAS
ncbi:hypothetical protein GCM10010988_39920 [Cnuibacter physcomitrellae]|uniref:Uncharacterized protein n=1 Tax=Cnuibacter physcomitrellae TaxID=1619308 RepID=A0A1X9LWK7_9MICO|nr:OB-fold domain-containing protein [Cnuibacter physcomitrellae]ARJ07679.1 hypothetical protein B5808_20110 [Cnuibacter physcomitrellae]GGI42614.1 hypothetical protein GCM10010988_39920 [Cnuibacter physcomitrellae]